MQVSANLGGYVNPTTLKLASCLGLVHSGKNTTQITCILILP